MGRSAPPAPDRITWAVDLLDVAPDDRILDIGGGPGVSVALVADQLKTGRVTAIDRSATAVQRSRARNAEAIADGRVTVQQTDLAGLPVTTGPFDKAFAVNVNVFWTGSAEAEGEVLARVLRPGGRVWLVYAGPDPGGPRDVTPTVRANLERHGFTTEVVRSLLGAGMVGVLGRLGGR